MTPTGSVQCDKCFQPMKLIAAGVSKKTGKAYSAFYTCEDCKLTKSGFQMPSPPQPSPMEIINKNISPVAPANPDWDKISFGKCRHGFALEAFKLQMQPNEQTASLLNKWATYSMTGSFEQDGSPNF